MKRYQQVQAVQKKYVMAMAHVFGVDGPGLGDSLVAASPENGYKATTAEQLLAVGFLAFDVVVTLNPATGWVFRSAADEQRAKEALRPAAMDAEPSGDALSQALQAAIGGADANEWPTGAEGLAVLNDLLHTDLRVMVMVQNAEALFPNGDMGNLSPADRRAVVLAQTWAKDDQIGASYKAIILLTEHRGWVHASLRELGSRVEWVHIGVPNREERMGYLRWLMAQKPFRLADGFTLEALADATAALLCLHIEDIILRAKAEDQPVTRAFALERKREIVEAQFSEVLQMWEPTFGFEQVGGLEYVKTFFAKNVVEPVRDGRLRRVPLAVLMAGPPGTGKSFFAQALAFEAGMNAAVLNPARILGKYVGDSERNMERVLEAIDALAPVLVFVDEVDQANVGGRGASGDSGVSNRLFGRLLQYMGDESHRGKVVFLLASNRPDLLDPAFKREGRVDAILAFLPPTSGAERRLVMEAAAKRMSIIMDGDAVTFSGNDLRLNGYTQAELAALVRKAAQVSEDAGQTCVAWEHMAHAIEAFIPQTRERERMTRLALAEIRDRDLLPPGYREQAGKDVAEAPAVEREAQPRALRDI